jgi:PAS domain S-box-containing protein
MPYMITQMVDLSLRHGHTAHSAEAYIQFALALHQGSPHGDARAAAFGRLAIALTRRYAHPALTCRVLTTLVSTLNHWYAPLRSGLPLIREAYQAGLEAGDLQWAGYAALVTAYIVLAVGAPLAEVLREIEKGLSFAAKFENKLVVEVLTAYRQAVHALQGRTIAPGSFEDANFEEAGYMEQASGTPFVLGFYHILRLGVSYLFGDQRAARRRALWAAERLASMPGQVLVADHPYYTALNLAALWEEGSQVERAAWRAELVACEETLGGWARHAPENHRHRWALVAAERARIEQRPWEALERYNEAIEGAQAEDLVHDEALANELAGRFCLSRGQRRIARMHLRAASAAYARWGARAKEEALAREFPEWMQVGAPEWPTTDGTTAGLLHLDALSLLKAAQALSEEIDLDRLLEKLLHLATEAAGATRGALLLAEDDALWVRARSAQGQPSEIRLEHVSASEAEDLPPSILRYVWRSRKTLELANAAHEPLFASDPVVSRGLRSVLCMPIAKQARLIGLLYLENDMMTGAFGPGRVELLRLLSSQMAISLENAQLIADLKRAAIVVLNSQAVLFRWRIAEEFPVEYVSENVERVFGYAAADLCSGAVPFMSIVHPADRARILAEFAEVLASHREHSTYMYRLQSPDGAVRWVESNAHILREEVGPPRYVEAILVDITERKRAEEERTQLLLREQAARAEVESARALDRLKTTFVSAVSHDLRTPLTSIKGYAEFLEDEIGGPLTETQREYIMQIVKSGLRLEHLVDDLLDFARLEAGTFTLTVEPAGLTATIAEILDSFRPQAQSARLSLEAELPDQPIALPMDKARIERVLSNLINNAIKFTPEGGRIVVRAREEGGWVRCEVADTGIGIAPEDMPKLFQRFVQLEPGRPKGGTGLGLSISKAIVEAHGGRIGAESRPGNGSTFWFMLPLQPPS